MASASDLTYAQIVGSSGLSASDLTYAQIVSAVLSASDLTYARMASAGAAFIVDPGAAQTIDAFDTGVLIAGIPDPTVSATLTWSFLFSSNPKVTSVPVVNDGAGGAVYLAPAAQDGTVLTFKVTAHPTTGADAVATVQHTIRPHLTWMVTTARAYQAVSWSVVAEPVIPEEEP